MCAPEQNRHDQDLEKVLASLRTREAPSGMEQRVHLALARHAAVAPARTPLSAALVWFLRVAPVAAAACALVLLAVPHHHAITRPGHLDLHTPAPSFIPKRRQVAAALPQDARSKKVLAHSETLPARTERSPAPMQPALAGSHPPPPLPLTPQELLLLQLARRDSAEARPLLDPALQNRQLAELDQAFERFFTPPVIAPSPQEKPEPAPSGENQ